MSEERRRVCLLTGASGVLGSAFRQLYGHRYDIVAVYHETPPDVPRATRWNVDPLRPDARIPVDDEHRFAAIRADLSDATQIPRVVDAGLAVFGQIDVVVNAAVSRCGAPLVGAEPATLEVNRMFGLNVLAPWYLAAELARKWWYTRIEENAAFNRNVVNVSSTSGAYIFGRTGQAAYSATKAALNMLTSHMAEEFAEFGVRVNSVAPDNFPGAVSTESVCDAIVRVEEGKMTGEMLMLESYGARVL